MLCIILLSRLSISTKRRVSINKSPIVLPIRLIIPQISVDAPIEYVGVTSTGIMEVPKKTDTVGWFKLGAVPGENGSAIIAGHLNGQRGENGVFFNLNSLKKGDLVTVKNSDNSQVQFIVHKIKMLDPGHADDVFTSSEGAHLNLITCDGIWDKKIQSYSQRLVLFTDLTVSK